MINFGNGQIIELFEKIEYTLTNEGLFSIKKGFLFNGRNRGEIPKILESNIPHIYGSFIYKDGRLISYLSKKIITLEPKINPNKPNIATENIKPKAIPKDNKPDSQRTYSKGEQQELFEGKSKPLGLEPEEIKDPRVEEYNENQQELFEGDRTSRSYYIPFNEKLPDGYKVPTLKEFLEIAKTTQKPYKENSLNKYSREFSWAIKNLIYAFKEPRFKKVVIDLISKVFDLNNADLNYEIIKIFAKKPTYIFYGENMPQEIREKYKDLLENTSIQSIPNEEYRELFEALKPKFSKLLFSSNLGWTNLLSICKIFFNKVPKEIIDQYLSNEQAQMFKDKDIFESYLRNIKDLTEWGYIELNPEQQKRYEALREKKI